MNPNIKTAHQYLDWATNIVSQKSASEGHPICCSKGCSHCCSDPAYASASEIQRALALLDHSELEYVTTQTRHWLAQVTPSPLYQEHLPNANQWRELNAPCPFLKDHLCLIYKRRPLACRTYLASRHPFLCSTPSLRSQQQFAHCETMLQTAGAILFMGESPSLSHDHIGSLLSHALLHSPHPSGSYQHFSGDLLELLRHNSQEILHALNPGAP